MKRRLYHLGWLMVWFCSGLRVPCAAQVVINEIMYAPDDPEPEWIELFNAASTPVDLAGWSVSDGSTRGNLGPATIEPGAFLLLTRDTTNLKASRPDAAPLIQLPMPVLNNDGDRLTLLDRNGAAVDSVAYKPAWGGQGGRSLERRETAGSSDDEGTWGESAADEGATAGYLNSISVDRQISDSIVINEIMFDPLDVAGESGAEYVEIFNAGSRPVSTAGWRLYDGTDKSQMTVPPGSSPIAPSGYLLLTSDSLVYHAFPSIAGAPNIVLANRSSFSLNLDSDRVVIRDRYDRTLDSVPYRGDWHRPDAEDTKGISLERISSRSPSADRRNWSSSTNRDGGTPGRSNSTSIVVTADDAELSLDPPVVSPDGDGFEDFTRLSFRLPSATSRIMVTIYDRYGRYARRIANNELAGAEGELIWDGRSDSGDPLPPGIYIVRLEAYDDGGRGLMTVQKGIVVARKLD